MAFALRTVKNIRIFQIVAGEGRSQSCSLLRGAESEFRVAHALDVCRSNRLNTNPSGPLALVNSARRSEEALVPIAQRRLFCSAAAFALPALHVMPLLNS